MIAKTLYGTRTYGLLQYLYGPGTGQEHHDARMVACWDVERDPRQAAGPLLWALAERLDRPVHAYRGRIARHVWHTSVRCAPEDPALTDEQWAQIARRMVAAAGIAPAGDAAACRWVAVRHADDHIHIVATLVRQDARQPDLRGDWMRLRDECRRIETELGLRATAPPDRSVARGPTRAEYGKAHRVMLSGDVSPARQVLARRVREVAVVAVSEEDFFSRLEAAGIRVKLSELPSGELVGYAVALPGDRNRDGDPVWYSGSRLASDLSLPRVRQRFDLIDAPALLQQNSQAADEHARRSRQQVRAETWRQAAQAVHAAQRVLVKTGHGEVATVAALGDLMTVAAAQAPGAVRNELAAAARAFNRAGGIPWHAHTEASLRIRRAVLAIGRAGQTIGSGDENAAVLATVVAGVLVTRTVASYYRLRRMSFHADAARIAGQYLQAAAEHLGARPAAPFDHAAASRSHLQDVVRQAVAGHVDSGRVLADPAWPALAGLLHRLERLGADPGAVLREIIMQRPLRGCSRGSARSEAQVLTWRLQHWVADHAATVGPGAPLVPDASPPVPQRATPPSATGLAVPHGRSGRGERPRRPRPR